MREFDHGGLLLDEYQGKLFEASHELPCSSGIFIRRFLHSDLCRRLDENDPSSVSMDVDEGMGDILRQFGDSDYGSVKYSASALFWIGYLYRYISYTRDQPTRLIAKIFDHGQMNDVYYPYHTQDPEWCVRSLLEANGLTEDVFDNNYRLRLAIRAS